MQPEDFAETARLSRQNFAPAKSAQTRLRETAGCRQVGQKSRRPQSSRWLLPPKVRCCGSSNPRVGRLSPHGKILRLAVGNCVLVHREKQAIFFTSGGTPPA